MHPVGFFALSILATLFSQETTPASTQEQLPSGPYQQTCTDISIKNGNLYAKCQDDKGKLRSARLSHYEKCSAEIANKKGSLECPHGAASPPAGPYTESCKNAQMKGTTLYAVCKSADGAERPVSLKDANRCSQGVINLNGILSCAVSDVIPPGSYMGSCKDIRLQGTSLYAECNDGKDRWMKTQLREAQKCPGDISNYHGQLRCVDIKKVEKR
jgi:CVNH domain-containing protein